MRSDLDELKTLGRRTDVPTSYDPSVLEAFGNRYPDRDYWVTFTAPEFTTLCPKTGQPDFAELTIRYIPAKKLVESKSLKLYLFGFRNHGDFHEDVVNVVYDDLSRLLRPKYMEVVGKFAARGGISIDPFVNGGTGAKYKALAAKRFAEWSGVRGRTA
ncbi:MAG: preQ(1) synthase [Kiritimatiellae bacterium]|nr:preQ(1) synthase [Kiritimatiellia bacterium]MBQ6328065.1 preQ(1) synthase [Kiritimatiellia bacterium]